MVKHFVSSDGCSERGCWVPKPSDNCVCEIPVVQPPASMGVPVQPIPLVTAENAAGLQIADGQRFGLHNLRHSLSNWLVNKAKVEPKTVQSILRHSRIQTTLDIYIQGDGDETRAAQGAFLKELGMASEMVQ